MRGALLCLLAVAAPAAAQVAPPPTTYAVSAWTTREGIPQSAVNTLALDPEGYLWLGTNVGLARFDGDTFVAYPRAAEPPAPDPVRGMRRDGEGRLWFLVPNVGVFRVLPGGRVERVRSDYLSGMTHLAVGSGEDAWLGRFSDVRRLADGGWRPVPGLPKGIVGDVRVLARDTAGALWVGGAQGVVRFEPSAGRARRIEVGCGEIRDIEPDAAGGAWIATCAGVEYAAPGAARAVPILPGRNAQLQLVVDDVRDVLWTADGDGIRRFRLSRAPDGTWRTRLVYRHSLDLDGALPSAMIPDEAGGVFVGTNGAGLRHVRRLEARRLTVADGLPGRAVHHLAADDSTLWIGNCQGLSRWRGGTLAVVEPAAMGMSSACVHGLLHDRRGALWIGEFDQLVRVDATGRWRRMLGAAFATRQEVSPLLEDSRGRVWFANTRGVAGWFAPGDTVPVVLAPGALAPDRVSSMAEDAEGAVWIGQRGRVTRCADGGCTPVLDTTHGLPDVPVRGLLFDRDGSLWLATYGGGLARWDAARGLARLRPRGRAYEHLLSAIRLDRHDRLWLLGDGGVTAVSRASAAAAISRGTPLQGALDVAAPEGVPEGNGGYANAWLDAVAEQLWVATVDGVAILSVASAPLDRRALPVHVDDARLDDALAGRADTLRVPAGTGAMELHFSTPLFGLASAAQVRYRLRGYDREWIEAGSARVARYANVKPGRYVFEVVVDNGVGGPVPAGDELPVIVAAHWWETLLARALGAALAVGLVWVLVRWSTGRIRERNRALQREIAERERAERQAAEAARELAHVSRIATAGELATSIAHELNQPLAAVMGCAQQARHYVNRGDVDGAREMLGHIEDQSERAAEVIRSLRAFVLKQHSWDPDITPEGVVAETLRLVRQELTGRGVLVDILDARRAPRELQGSGVQLQQVLANLLLNAADAVEELPPERRRVTIRMADEPEGGVRLSVRNDGAGIPADQLEQVFAPFYTTKPNGLGLGLSLSRSIVEAHGGRLWAERPPEGGTVFHIVLPGHRP